ncbi:sodium channel protein Nach-like [Prorops nasuta]|uniref:sodium channel protein Nach-like n=1 Tax=Prorops nasuta TaxID=863751 RepID=UPI0034CF1AB2
MKYDYCPTCKDLHTSLKCRSKEYLLENPLHGVPYFVDSTRPIWERIIWLILFMTSLGATIGTIITIWGKFQNAPTFTGLISYIDDITIDFPQIQLCVDWPNLNYSRVKDDEFYKQTLSATYNFHPDNFDKFRNRNNNFHDSLLRLVQTLAPDCGALYSNCSFLNVNRPCNEFLEAIITPAGACCRFRSVSITKSAIPAVFKFQPAVYPIKLYTLGKIDSGPLPGEEASSYLQFSTRTSINLDITISTDAVRSLSRSQRKCNYNTSINNCEIKCFSKKIWNRCKCLPWFLSPQKDEECHFSFYNCVNRPVDLTDCKCLLPCDFTAYSIRERQLKIYDTNRTPVDISSLNIPKWPKNLFNRDVKFGAIDLLTSFGGIAGLFLGYSLVTTVELFYYFTLRTYCGAVMNSATNKESNIITVHVITPRDKKQKSYIESKPYVKNMIFEYLD